VFQLDMLKLEPVTAPENVPVVPATAAKVPAAGVEPPITAPSIVPPLTSAVVATKEVNVPAAGVVPPIVTLSNAPPLRSIVPAVTVPETVTLANVAVPVNVGDPKFALLHWLLE
jgi:hypothetical protein